MGTLSKDEAAEKMKVAGYDCSVIDGVLTFTDEYTAMDKIPTIEPKRKKGEWINGGRIIRCNKCKTGYAVVKGME